MRPAARWTLLTILALAVILAPFAIWEEPITAWVQQTLRDEQSRPLLAAILGGLLAVDVLLPIPSSLISTAAGYVFGFTVGALVSWCGMTVGALLGYALGSRPARALTRRFVGDAELSRAQAAFQRWGVWALVISRATPVLAEASVVFAGVVGMDWRKFVALVALANLAVSLVYAAVGAWALEANSFLLAFLGAILLPGAALWLFRKLRT
jgi:uncharacterized membrane protein YdjX (TVP38/TMEM64 family)